MLRSAAAAGVALAVAGDAHQPSAGSSPGRLPSSSRREVAGETFVPTARMRQTSGSPGAPTCVWRSHACRSAWPRSAEDRLLQPGGSPSSGPDRGEAAYRLRSDERTVVLASAVPWCPWPARERMLGLEPWASESRGAKLPQAHDAHLLRARSRPATPWRLLLARLCAAAPPGATAERPTSCGSRSALRPPAHRVHG
jgi:hypothetical protein